MHNNVYLNEVIGNDGCKLMKYLMSAFKPHAVYV